MRGGMRMVKVRVYEALKIALEMAQIVSIVMHFDILASSLLILICSQGFESRTLCYEQSMSLWFIDLFHAIDPNHLLENDLLVTSLAVSLVC
jgi:hypothetical protein